MEHIFSELDVSICSDKYKALLLAFAVHYPGFVPFFVNLLRSQGDPPTGVEEDSWEYDYLEGSGNEIYHRELDSGELLLGLWEPEEGEPTEGNRIRAIINNWTWKDLVKELLKGGCTLIGFAEPAANPLKASKIDVVLSPEPEFSEFDRVKSFYVIADSDTITTSAFVGAFKALKDRFEAGDRSIMGGVKEIEMPAIEAPGDDASLVKKTPQFCHRSYQHMQQAIEEYSAKVACDEDHDDSSGKLHAKHISELIKQCMESFDEGDDAAKMVLAGMNMKTGAPFSPRIYTSSGQKKPVLLIFHAAEVHYGKARIEWCSNSHFPTITCSLL